MAQQIINIGSTVNDGTGDTLRTGAQKINANFAELYLTTIPTQTGNAGKFLTTNGTGTSWAPITDVVTAAANQLTGTTLAPQVVTSSLTTVGTLENLTVTNTIQGSISGNAGTVTHGVYTDQIYNNPAWIGSLAGSKIAGDIVGNSGTVTNGVYTNQIYNNPTWLSSLSPDKVLPSPVGKAGKFLQTTGAAGGYSWESLTSLPGGSANKLLYQTAPGTTGFIASPASAGTFLKWNGSSFEWTATGAGQGTVTLIEGVGTVSGLTLTGSVVGSGNLTLGGTLTLTSGNVTSGLGYIPAKLDDFSVVVNTPSGPGNLAYNDGTGVFTFTPPAPPVGTVSSFAFTDGNGFDGTVTTSTSTPTLSLSMTVSGLLKGNGTGIESAVAGTDYIAPYGTTAANYVFASPNATNGVPQFRPLVSSDIPVLNQNTTGSAAKFTTPRNINGQSFDGTADINITVPVSTGITGMANGVATFLATPTSSNLATIITDETGSGSVVFSSSPTITSPTIVSSLNTASTSFDLLPTSAVTVNIAGAATTLAIGQSDDASSLTSIVTGATASGNTKTINIGAGGLAGSTTAISLGSSASTGTVEMFGSTTIAGNLTLSGTGRAISADFTNATVASRAYFKSSTLNGQTSLIAVPNGSSTDAKVGVVNNSTPTNSSRIYIGTNASTDVQVVSDTFGSGTYLPMTFWTNGAAQVKLDISGNFRVQGAGALGYGTGSGGTVTQGTSRTTGVTLNKTNGAITLFSATAVVGTFTSFTVTNDKVEATDVVQVSMKSGSADSYIFNVTAVTTGSFRIQIFHPVDVLVAEAPVLNFAVIKAVTA